MPYLETGVCQPADNFLWPDVGRGRQTVCGANSGAAVPLGTVCAHACDDSPPLRVVGMQDGTGCDESIRQSAVRAVGRWGEGPFSEGREASGDRFLGERGERLPLEDHDGWPQAGRARSASLSKLATPAWVGSTSSDGGGGRAAGEKAMSEGTPAEAEARSLSCRCDPGRACFDWTRGRVVPSPVGGISPLLGAVAYPWRGGLTPGDVGASHQPSRLAGAGRMESPLVLTYPRVKLVFDSAKERRGRRGSGCQVESCQIERAQLKADLASVRHELSVERNNRNTLVRGDVRAADVSVREMERELEGLRASEESSKRCRLMWQRKAEELGTASMAQTEEIASLKAEIASLHTQLSKMARQLAAAELNAAGLVKRHERAERAMMRNVDKALSESKAAVSAAEQQAADAEEEASLAREVAASAREEALMEADIFKARAVEAGYEWSIRLVEKRLKYAQDRVANSVAKPHVPSDRTPEEWASLSLEAQRKATECERRAIKVFLTSHSWRTSDVAAVLHAMGMLKDLFDSSEGTTIFMWRVKKMLVAMEERDFGVQFALFLHFEMQMTLDKVHLIVQAACKTYQPSTNRYSGQVLMYDKYRKQNIVKIGDDREQELMARDLGKYGSQSLSAFTGGQLKLPIVISWDATGFVNQQFTTAVVNNPYTPKSAQLLHVLGLGNCSDSREGTVKVLGPNRAALNDMIAADRNNQSITYGTCTITPEVFVCTDVSALRHCEHIACSGWCCCSSEVALRSIPIKPSTFSELEALLMRCKSPTLVERYVLSHNTLPGEDRPRPCTACTFAHDPLTAMEEQRALYVKESELAKADTKAGKRAFADFRMQHARMHGNIQPGKYGEPLLHHDMMDQQLLDPLHLAKLGIPKTPWKHGVLNNASDDAREAISQQLSEWKHPLDCRRKDDNRVRAQKWFTGEAWGSFCAGSRGSPGGPRGIAALMLIVADDMQLRGVSSGSQTLCITEQQAASGGLGSSRGRGTGRAGRGRIHFVRNVTAHVGMTAEPANEHGEELPYQPTAIERASDPEDLEMIRKMFGSRADTIINTLLAFDAYFAWYYPLNESIPFRSPMELRRLRALDNCRRAIDMQEIMERVTIHHHKSYLFHGAIYKVSRDILRVGDIWATDISALELLNADTKRTAQTGDSKRLTMSTQELKVAPRMSVKQGPANLVTTKGYSTTMALSTLRKLIGKNYLREGSGLVSLPESRRRERLFGESGTGRVKPVRAASSCMELLGSDYDPCADTCVKAFVRLIGLRAEEQAAAEV